MVIGYCFNAYAYDNVTTHKKVTEKAVDNSQLRNYLKQNFGYASGYEEKIRGKRIIDWLIEGSYLEDILACRASNHFHNPLLPWGQSYMTDQPGWIDEACLDWKPWFSNITWATRFLAPPPDGAKTTFGLYKTYDWDTARQVYYRAITNTDKFYRDMAFTDTFVTLGHIIHLLQDMSVPAHTRNDFQSHLFINNNNPFDRYQPFEKYVEINPTLVATANPAGNFPSFTNTRLTDFWDTNQYTGSNPSTGANIGLAEFSNANYFSNYTILSNGPTLEHNFPRPSINNAEYQICTDYQHNSSEKRKYVSRKSKGACPQLSTERKADHFATASLINAESLITNSNISNLRLWLDNNVHNTYGKDIIPRAVGYSAGLLDYFFRGSIEITLPSNGVYSLTDNPAEGFKQLTLLARNTTSNGDEMNDGSIELVVGYKRAQTDPFQSGFVPVDGEFTYIVVPEANNIRTITKNGSTELTFNIAQGLPLDAKRLFSGSIQRMAWQ